MKHADIKSMMAEIAPVIREFATATVAPLMERLDALEKQLAAMPVPKDGKSVSLEDVAPLVETAVRNAVDAIPTPKEGKSVTDIDVDLIEEGNTAVFRFTVGDVEHAFEVPLPAGPAGENGKDGRDGIPGEKGEPGRDGVDGNDGRDGLDVKDLFRADGGKLIAVMSDGTTKDLGVFVGKDGNDGADGIDGVGFDDMSCEVRSDGVYLVWEKGEVAKEARLPIPLDMGVYKTDRAYLRGHCVTWGGSVWIAQKDGPQGKPDAPESDWRLCVKKGRDGKDSERK